jgi:hypothetical protein
MATQTPWGKSQQSRKIARGLTFHSTSSHGGFLVSAGFAERHLSPAAIARGQRWGNYYAYEEDCLAAIVELEIPATRGLFQNPEGITDESLIRTLSRWYADYLIERGITPEPEGYAYFLQMKEDERLRAERSPDLIVCAESVDANTVRVTTADRKEHLVTSDSYRARSGLNLLSKCVGA